MSWIWSLTFWILDLRNSSPESGWTHGGELQKMRGKAVNYAGVRQFAHFEKKLKKSKKLFEIICFGERFSFLSEINAIQQQVTPQKKQLA